jgi:formylglycine-generating enzyme required for sulfatase activity
MVSNGVADDAVVTIKVIGIEMVYINSGSFYLGDQYASGTFIKANAANSSPPYNNFYINSATNPTIQGRNSSSSVSNLSAHSALDLGTTTTTATLAAGFPNGYNAFYLMKHEISQRQYVEFLNMLTRAQQNSRTETSLGSGVTSVTNRYVMTNTASIDYRNGISCAAVINSTDPIVFFNDLNGNGIGNESDDGGWIAANYLSWGDLAAYLDWCGLRPITELEYEKSCRGTAVAQKDEYAWGTETPTPLSGLSNEGQYNESPSSSTHNCAIRLESYQIGPFRVGMFARATTSRRYSGGSFYGVLDLTGNVSELLVAIGEPIGRGFNGSHGNGELNATGDADAATWPQTAGYGSGYRGGGWSTSAAATRVSDRLSCGGNNPQSRNQWRGGRGGRTAP